MSKEKSLRDQFPAWFLEGYANQPEPTEEELRYFDFMKADFMAALDEACDAVNALRGPVPSLKQSAISVGENIMTAAGRILERAAESSAENFLPPPAEVRWGKEVETLELEISG